MKKYPVILADPPWGYANWTDAKNGAAVSSYPVLKDKDIIDLPVGDIAEKDAMLFLWATWPKLDVAMKCIESWGFQYVTCPEVWVKTNADGSPYCGIGFWARGGSEFVLMARRGKGIPRLPRKGNTVLQVTTAPRTRHSEKPDGLHDKIERLLGKRPAIELFARKDPPIGWDATGLDFDGKDIRDFLRGT